jgi:adenine-specific DNA-methyltransferase
MHRATQPQLSLWDESLAVQPAARPTESAFWRGSLASRSRSREEQKQLGQFITPAPIARMMAAQMVAGREWGGQAIRLLDPAAGSGVLAAALVEAVLASAARPSRIELLLCEIDASMLPLLRGCARELESLCSAQGVGFEYRVQEGDFLLSELARSQAATVDAVIANPPYFKLSGGDERARFFAHAVHGQPNIYALFMASCAQLLRPGGAYCFITPRSWTNGAYFRALRAQLLSRLTVQALHLFESREAHFQADAVLQEAMVVWACAGPPQAAIAVSSSHGSADLNPAGAPRWPAGQVLGPAPERIVIVPDADSKHALADMPLRLRDLGLTVSTGPVVGFRAAAHLRATAGPSTMPMLWMPHVRSMHIEWPRRHRAEHIEANDASAWMLLPNRPMVLLRRFSPKEDARRITAAPYLAGLPGKHIGLENHLNVIHSVAGHISGAAVEGLAAYLNSLPVDRYLRRLLGSTQINAVELRNLPVPDMAALERIGRGLARAASLDAAVESVLQRAVAPQPVRHA